MIRYNTQSNSVSQAIEREIMQIETLDLRTISEADARAAAELLVAVWPKPDRTVDSVTSDMLKRWKDYGGAEAQHPRAFVIREDVRMIAHAAAYPRTIGTSAGDMTVLALARVCTDQVARGRKLGQAVTRAAFDLVDNGTFPFALFQTSEAVRAFYDRLGAAQIDNHFINSIAEDPAASPFWDRVIIRYPAKAGWPTGEIDLRGPAW